MHPVPLAGAIGVAIFLAVRRRHVGRTSLALGAAVVAGLALWGLGVVEPPNLTKLIEDVGRRLGKWTYLLVGALAFLETGAFVGLVAPGESAVLIGGVVAGQGQISIVALIALVWACAVAGDCTSYALGRRLGRGFLERHGPRLKITEARLAHVEDFFHRHGGATILIGRFIGLVRALAPFIAGASRMELRTFLPYDVLGAGLWSALFCLLGYFFWQSLDKVQAYIGRGAAAFAALVVVGLAIRFAVRLRKDRELRARVLRRLDANPVWRRVRGPLGFAWERVTPGVLGLELTTLVAIAAVGLFGFFGLESMLGTEELATLDRDGFRIVDPLYTPMVRDVVRVLTDVGSLPVTGLAVLVTAVWAFRARRGTGEGIALVGGLAVTWAVVHIGKAATDRPRPGHPHASAEGLAYPSGHSAYAVALVACAIVLARGGHRLATRFAIVGVAVGVAAAIALSRVYLRVHYPSDAVGGLALGAAVFALAGIATLTVTAVRHNGGR
jgi:membrane protein DedA with SNARE-associated domain/membrane-associated phospholipid phosphatase